MRGSILVLGLVAMTLSESPVHAVNGSNATNITNAANETADKSTFISYSNTSKQILNVHFGTTSSTPALIEISQLSTTSTNATSSSAYDLSGNIQTTEVALDCCSDQSCADNSLCPCCSDGSCADMTKCYPCCASQTCSDWTVCLQACCNYYSCDDMTQCLAPCCSSQSCSDMTQCYPCCNDQSCEDSSVCIAPVAAAPCDPNLQRNLAPTQFVVFQAQSGEKFRIAINESAPSRLLSLY